MEFYKKMILKTMLIKFKFNFKPCKGLKMNGSSINKEICWKQLHILNIFVDYDTERQIL